jgi:hypothetical protein
MTNKKKSVDNLFDEIFDIEAECDSKTLKQKIQLKMKECDQIEEEIFKVI